jgi:hypothetical protein
MKPFGVLLLLFLHLGIALCDKKPDKDAFCTFLESKDRNEEKKVEFMPLGKVSLGYVGKWKMLATRDIKVKTILEYSRLYCRSQQSPVQSLVQSPIQSTQKSRVKTRNTRFYVRI